jgi:hypothetical protein
MKKIKLLLLTTGLFFGTSFLYGQNTKVKVSTMPKVESAIQKTRATEIDNQVYIQNERIIVDAAGEFAKIMINKAKEYAKIYGMEEFYNTYENPYHVAIWKDEQDNLFAVRFPNGSYGDFHVYMNPQNGRDWFPRKYPTVNPQNDRDYIHINYPRWRMNDKIELKSENVVYDGGLRWGLGNYDPNFYIDKSSEYYNFPTDENTAKIISYFEKLGNKIPNLNPFFVPEAVTDVRNRKLVSAAADNFFDKIVSMAEEYHKRVPHSNYLMKFKDNADNEFQVAIRDNTLKGTIYVAMNSEVRIFRNETINFVETKLDVDQIKEQIILSGFYKRYATRGITWLVYFGENVCYYSGSRDGFNYFLMPDSIGAKCVNYFENLTKNISNLIPLENPERWTAVKADIKNRAIIKEEIEQFYDSIISMAGKRADSIARADKRSFSGGSVIFKDEQGNKFEVSPSVSRGFVKINSASQEKNSVNLSVFKLYFETKGRKYGSVNFIDEGIAAFTINENNSQPPENFLITDEMREKCVSYLKQLTENFPNLIPVEIINGGKRKVIKQSKK